jgi:GNAT superfamily N-acetyltransferase
MVVVYGGTRAQEMAQVDWTIEQKVAFVQWQFEMQEQEYSQRYPDARYDVILVDGVPAGRMWVGVDEKQIRLLDIAIIPQFQNRGVGTKLVKQLMDEAVQAHKVLRHMVFMFNDNAYRFYERLGFVTIEDIGGYKHMEWPPNQSQTPASS